MRSAACYVRPARLPAQPPRRRQTRRRPLPQGCGAEGGPCCVASRANRFEVTCDAGLTCIPPEGVPYRSNKQREGLAGAAFAKGYRDPRVVGACVKAPKCNAPYNPCGAEECPGSPMACPSGFYCANYADATVGARCVPLPATAGKAGGPCLPSNFPVRAGARGVRGGGALQSSSPDGRQPAAPPPTPRRAAPPARAAQGAPTIASPGVSDPVRPPFCPGEGDVCFTFTGYPTLRHRSFASIFDAKASASSPSRIWGTRCVPVPASCGGPGEACCPGVSSAVVLDKPLPSSGQAWAGRPCDDTLTDEGAYCDGAARRPGALRGRRTQQAGYQRGGRK